MSLENKIILCPNCHKGTIIYSNSTTSVKMGESPIFTHKFICGICEYSIFFDSKENNPKEIYDKYLEKIFYI